MRYKLLIILIILGLIPIFYALTSLASTSDNIRFFISEEVKPCLTSGGNAKACDINNSADLLVLNMTHNLRNDWVSHSLNNCSETPIRGNYIDGSTVEFLTPTFEKVTAKISLRDISINDSQTNSLGVPATTQGSLSTTPGSTMQDNSPKSISWIDLPYWTESSGSNLEGSRNAILIEFVDEAGLPYEVASFGAWFGDLETRADVLPASVITYDRNGNMISPKVDILENQGTDLTKCGASTSLGQGCGNQTTRWIGFTDLDDRNVQKVLITVGEDDLGGDGSREHISFTGPTIIRNYGCASIPTITVAPSPIPTVTINSTPVATQTPDITSTPTASITMTPSLSPTSTITNTPLPTLTLTPSLTPTVMLLITPSPSSAPLPSTTEKPTPSKTASPTPTQKVKEKDCCKKKPQKKLLKNLIRNLIKLLIESYQRRIIYRHLR